MKTVTFKNQERTGRYRSFEREQSDIKHEGKQIGWITETESGYEIWLHKQDSASISGFKNVRLKKSFASMNHAKCAFKNAWNDGIITIPIYHLD